MIPSLPGFAFSASAPANRWPALFVELMESLGYSRFAVHGGDIGAMVANRIALEAPERVTALHVTFLVEPAVAAPSEAEQAFLAERRRGQEEGGAYAHVQRTRPQTLALALADSPAGLAAWISERWREWSVRPIDAEELLTALTIYWVTGTIGTSFRPYADWALGSASLGLAWEGVAPGVDSRPLPPGARIEVPTAITLFGERWPRSWAERGYADIRRWREVDGVGHFPGLEAPDVLADELRASVV